MAQRGVKATAARRGAQQNNKDDVRGRSGANRSEKAARRPAFLPPTHYHPASPTPSACAAPYSTALPSDRLIYSLRWAALGCAVQPCSALTWPGLEYPAAMCSELLCCPPLSCAAVRSALPSKVPLRPVLLRCPVPALRRPQHLCPVVPARDCSAHRACPVLHSPVLPCITALTPGNHKRPSS